MPDSYFVTTPIFYANDVPHIGNAYTEIIADALARWARLQGRQTFMLTGTDEHGEKVFRTAAANNVPPQQWVDEQVRKHWLPLLNTVNIDNDEFIRTTSPAHIRAVEYFATQLRERGFIYEGVYEGYYCIGCEEYKTVSELTGHNPAYLCAIHLRPVEIVSQRNYFFRLSNFQERLLAYFDEHPDFISPPAMRTEVANFVRAGLEDLSISRSDVQWGIRVPWDTNHVIYVWFDALINYVSALGWPWEPRAFETFWPGTHVIGKDIARFHAIIWPAMLMAMDMPLPKRILGHGWLLVNNHKMSKSLLNGIYPSEIVSHYGSDAFRYYFLRYISLGQDGSFSWADFNARYNADLANGLGNLLSRATSLIVQRRATGSIVSGLPSPRSLDSSTLQALAQETLSNATQSMNEQNPSSALHYIWNLVEEANRYLSRTAPWKIDRDDDFIEVMQNVIASLQQVAVMVAPFMPNAATIIWDTCADPEVNGPLTLTLPHQLRVESVRLMSVRKVDTPIFPRRKALSADEPMLS